MVIELKHVSVRDGKWLKNGEGASGQKLANALSQGSYSECYRYLSKHVYAFEAMQKHERFLTKNKAFQDVQSCVILAFLLV